MNKSTYDIMKNRYNKIMDSIGREHLTIGGSLSELTDEEKNNWTVADMLSEVKFQLEYREYEPEEYKDEIVKCKRFIKRFYPLVIELKTQCYSQHCSNFDNINK